MKIQNIIAVTGTYKAKDGTEKKQYTTIGKLLTKDDGKQSVKIETIPLGRDGRANIYDQERKTEEAPKETYPGQNQEEMPF